MLKAKVVRVDSIAVPLFSNNPNYSDEQACLGERKGPADAPFKRLAIPGQYPDNTWRVAI